MRYQQLELLAKKRPHVHPLPSLAWQRWSAAHALAHGGTLQRIHLRRCWTCKAPTCQTPGQQLPTPSSCESLGSCSLSSNVQSGRKWIAAQNLEPLNGWVLGHVTSEPRDRDRVACHLWASQPWAVTSENNSSRPMRPLWTLTQLPRAKLRMVSGRRCPHVRLPASLLLL